MGMLINIREFFWPLLEKGEPQVVEQLSKDKLNIKNENVEKVLEFAIKNYESEDARKSIVESKASLFIGTISVVTSVIIGVTSLLFKAEGFSVFLCPMVFVLFILTIYMARTVWFSVQTLERKAYHTISPEDFLIAGKKSKYYKNMIIGVINKTRRNSITINSKVDSMTMAQEYFKRAIVTIVFYSFTIFLYSISKASYDFTPKVLNTINILNTIEINSVVVVSLYFLSVMSIIFQIFLFVKMKQKNKVG
jgi:hypothetical protein